MSIETEWSQIWEKIDSNLHEFEWICMDCHEFGQIMRNFDYHVLNSCLRDGIATNWIKFALICEEISWILAQNWISVI